VVTHSTTNQGNDADEKTVENSSII